MKTFFFDIVIFGGGFCGLLVAQHLEKHLKNKSIALIDKKTYYEFTPSIHKVIFKKNYLKKITIPYKTATKKTKILTEFVKKITPTEIQTNKSIIKYKYLVISSGISYPIFLENKKNVFTLKYGTEAQKINNKLRTSNHILIVGGGLIGTEIAGELVTKTNKKLTIVDPNDRLLSRNPIKASEYAKNFFEKHNAKIIFNSHVIKNEKGKFFYTDTGDKIKADMALWCAGIKADPFWLGQEFKNCLDERKYIKVNKFLQMDKFPNIFVGGDITAVKEEKTAQNAERQANVIATNIINLIEKNRLTSYKPRSGPLVISLGDFHGIFTIPWKSFTLTGIIPGIMKWVIHYLILLTTKYRICWIRSV